MKKLSLVALLAMCLLVTVSMASCQFIFGGEATDTEATGWTCVCGTENNSGNFCPSCGEAKPLPETTDAVTDEVTGPVDETDTETTASTTAAEEETGEPATAAPRYDYFDADVKADVEIDASVYGDMKLTLPADLKVTDEDVMDYVEYILFQYRTADNGTTQMTAQPMKLGDDAYIYYKGTIDGVEFEGGSNWDDTTPYQLGLGSGAFIPGFEEALVGVIPSEATKESPAEVRVTFPENYGSADLAGKDAVFYVAVMYAVQYTVPAYNRETVENTLQYEAQKDFYASDAALLSEFEGYVREYLESGVAEDVEYAKMSAIWEYLTEVATCKNLPQLELDYYYNAYLEEIEYYYDYYTAYGGSSFTETYPTLDDFAKVYMGVEEGEDWKDALVKLSEDMVKKDMITHAIAEMEGMETLTDEEFNAEVDYWVDYYSGYMTKEEILQEMGELSIREGALSEKMLTWLLEHATFTYEGDAV